MISILENLPYQRELKHQYRLIKMKFKKSL
jgi:hypothetical protein